ncbi:MAG: efflux RND transporter permease subunit, partial [Chloroflexi bacterium]|nr:efflux RND transporter permease subunit [Chloroflexota bacterium]
MWLTRLALHRPLVILMAAAALAMLGLRALFNMPAELNPRVDVPLITVMTVYPGASPEQVESVVTAPVEDSVGTLSGLQAIKSTSQEGLSVVEIQLQLGSDLDGAAAAVRQQIESARQNFPQDVYQPLVSGGDVEEVHVDLDPNRLASYGLSAAAVSYALQQASLDVPAGSVEQAGRNYSIRMVGQFSSLDQIRSVGLPGPPAGMAPGPSRTVTVGDVATVSRTIEAPTRITRVDLNPSVGISVVKSTDANTVNVAASVQHELKLLRPKLQALGVQVVVNQDQSILIGEALSDITSSLILGAILATVVVYLFLHDIRGTLIVACAIPTSLVVTFLVMHAAHFTLNQMTMLGLSIAVGILVDDSILVLENIYRHLQQGEPPQEAAFNGRTEIGLADITTTLVDVVVFVPIAFMGGIVGQFFKQFGLTVATATLTSMFVSFSFTPMLASRWYRARKPGDEYQGFAGKFNRFYESLDSRYRRLLAWALGRRFLVVGIAAVALGTALALGATQLKFEFIPTVDEGRVQVAVELAPSATLHDTDAIASQVENVVKYDPDVYSVFTTVGEITGGNWRVFPLQGPSYAQ